MLSWGATIWGAAASAVVALLAAWFFLRERRRPVLLAVAVASSFGPLAWNLILRHTGGDFFVDAPGYVFPISFQDTGSGVFATALAALVLGLGPQGADSARRAALTTMTCGLSALLVDIYLY
jgi:hypothetical protein